MKTLRRLAFAALFAVAASAFAQSPLPAAPGGTPPAPATPKEATADALREVMSSWYKESSLEGKGDATTFLLPGLLYTLDNGKGETMRWSVHFRLLKRADRPTAVRIFFPCKPVPADAHPDRLAELMNMSGGIQDSPAYFVIAGSGKDRTLTLVTEMSAVGLDRTNLNAEIFGLFRAAERTMNLWGADLTKPPAKAEKKAEKTGLEGEWNAHDPQYNSGSAPPRPLLAGLNSLYFTADGKVKAYVQRSSEKDNKGIDVQNGTYTLKGDQLSLWFDGRKLSEEYTIKIKDGKLTLIPDKGNSSSVTDKEIILNKW